jgi:hypothetical protein
MYALHVLAAILGGLNLVSASPVPSGTNSTAASLDRRANPSCYGILRWGDNRDAARAAAKHHCASDLLGKYEPRGAPNCAKARCSKMPVGASITAQFYISNRNSVQRGMSEQTCRTAMLKLVDGCDRGGSYDDDQGFTYR